MPIGSHSQDSPDAAVTNLLYYNTRVQMTHLKIELMLALLCFSPCCFVGDTCLRMDFA